MTYTEFIAVFAGVLFMVKIPLYAILTDTLVGVLISLKEGNFSITYFPQFLSKNVFPYIGSLLIFAFLAQTSGDSNLMKIFDFVVLGVTAKFSWEIIMGKIKGFIMGSYTASLVNK